MKTKNFLTITLTLCIALIGCSQKRPQALVQARQELERAKNDTFILEHAAVSLNQAENTYERAEQVWQETEDQEKVVPIARLAQEQIYDATLEAGKTASLELSEDLNQQRAMLRAEEALQTNRILIRELRQLSDQQLRERTVVTLNSDLLFEVDGTSLTAGGQNELVPLANFLTRHPNHKVRIEGHTDSTGDPAYNQQLSRRRAEAVSAFLRKQGIPMSRISIVGMGENYPIASNDRSAGRLQNRRVEVIITPA